MNSTTLSSAEHYLALYKEDLFFLGFSMEETTFHMQIARNYAIDFLVQQQFQSIAEAARPSLLEAYVVDHCLRLRLVRSEKGLEKRLASLKRFLQSLMQHRSLSSSVLSKAFSYLDANLPRWKTYLPKSGRQKINGEGKGC